MLEAMQHKDNAFVTLTYNDDNLPVGGNLVARDLQLFLKRFRLKWDVPIRFYGVGEYGDVSGRPHYHLALFGVQSCCYGGSRYSKSRSTCCWVCDLVQCCWGLGNVFLGSLEAESAHYIAGYVVKKWTRDCPALLGRRPEFARMSLRPGIGAAAMDDVASVLLWYELEQRLLDVPSSLRHGEKELPLGRYLRRRLRERVGKEASEPAEVSLERSKELHRVYADSIAGPEVSVAKLIAKMGETKALSMMARVKAYSKGRTL